MLKIKNKLKQNVSYFSVTFFNFLIRQTDGLVVTGISVYADTVGSAFLAHQVDGLKQISLSDAGKGLHYL